MMQYATNYDIALSMLQLIQILAVYISKTVSAWH